VKVRVFFRASAETTAFHHDISRPGKSLSSSNFNSTTRLFEKEVSYQAINLQKKPARENPWLVNDVVSY
jgi:hypothetical protein